MSTTYEDVINHAERICEVTVSKSPFTIVGMVGQKLASLISALEACEDKAAQPAIASILAIYGVDKTAAPDVQVSGIIVQEIDPHDLANGLIAAKL